jgi:hypothetical protein
MFAEVPRAKRMPEFNDNCLRGGSCKGWRVPVGHHPSKRATGRMQRSAGVAFVEALQSPKVSPAELGGH